MTDIDARTDPEALLAHGDFVRAVARSLLWDEHAAEDVVQQTWLAALGAPVGAHRGWLAAVARNLAIKRIRGDRRRVLRETAASRPEAAPSDQEILERERLRRSVVDEVLALPEPYRTTVLLRHLENLPPREVARRMDVPVETARTRTRRALEMLRVRLDARQGDDRGAFCAALAVWAGAPRDGTGTATTGTGGLVMGTKAVVACSVVAAGLAAWLLWPRDAAPPAVAAAEAPAVPAAPKPAPSPARTRTATPPEEAPPPKEVPAVVARTPVATVIVTAFDVDAGTLVREFACELRGKDLLDRPKPDADGRVEAAVPLASPAGDTVSVIASRGAASGRRDVALRDGDRVEVRVELRRDGEVVGRVVNAVGKPVADALAFFGEEDVARGDEPFKPFDAKRVKNAARTDADGRFQLSGAGRWITFWTADAGPVTVARGAASDVVLPARGIIRGVLRDADGKPDAGRKVFVDRMRETTTDVDGRFEFAGVEPGTRGLSLTGGKPKAYVAVRVAPGATVDVEMKPGLPSVRVEWPGRTNFGRAVGLVALDVVGSMAIGEPKDGAVVAKDVLPGKYLVMCEGGGLAIADVTGPTATAVGGTGEIVVHATAKTRVYVVPAGAGYLARLLAGRMAGAGVPADGTQRFVGLAPGRYDVGVERDGVRKTVEVKDGAVETSID